MGLDMYLNKKTYIGANYKHNYVKGTIKLTHGEDKKPFNIDLKRVSEIVERVGYWRKANQIHNWFVKNVQEGVDNCAEYYVSTDQLKQLLSDCQKVLIDSKMAESVLPTKSGFFFGGTDYDECYTQEINDTIEIIESVLKEKQDPNDRGEIYYTSSW